MHILLIEPHFTGHRPTYLYIYSKILLDSGHKVSIICGDDEKCREFLTIEKKLPEINVLPFKNTKRKSVMFKKYYFFPKYDFWKRLALSLKTVKHYDFVLFMYFDFFLFNFNAVPKIGQYLTKFFLPNFINKIVDSRWCGILFHPNYLKSVDYSFLNLIPNCSIAVLDETYELEYKVKKKYVWPDITDEYKITALSDLSRDVQKKAKGRKIISLLGSLEKRKGILPLLRVIEQMNPDEYFFLVSGQLDTNYTTEEKERIASFFPRENCYAVLDGIPTEYDFNSLVKISDILYLVYIGFPHSSNILTKAALFEKPVLCLEGFCMGRRVKKYNLGLTVKDPEAKEIENALANFDELFDKSKNKFEKYFSDHSQERLRQVLKQVIKN